MKTNFRTIALATLAVIASLSMTVNAQTLQARINVPFSFDCGSSHLSAGVYTLTVEDGQVLTLRSTGKYVVMALVHTSWNPTAAKNSEATFKKYGDRYFLEEITTSTSMNLARVIESDSERRAAREFVARGGAGSQISLALLPMDLTHAGN
jgi:hypothetical protein